VRGERTFSLPSNVVAKTLLRKEVQGRRPLPIMDKPWFDQETGTLLLDEYVVEMDSYRRIVEDETITDAELEEQTQRVTSLLQRLEEALSPEDKALATEALGELAVLNALQVKRLQAASMLPQ
jgi:predicted ribosome quality control (RQC) complex YloA/Tae2 family protein